VTADMKLDRDDPIGEGMNGAVIGAVLVLACLGAASCGQKPSEGSVPNPPPSSGSSSASSEDAPPVGAPQGTVNILTNTTLTDFKKSHPDADCVESHMPICEIAHPEGEDCPTPLGCKSVAYQFEEGMMSGFIAELEPSIWSELETIMSEDGRPPMATMRAPELSMTTTYRAWEIEAKALQRKKPGAIALTIMKGVNIHGEHYERHLLTFTDADALPCAVASKNNCTWEPNPANPPN